MISEKIFISYSRKDKEKVFAIRNEIEKATLQKCWIDLNGIESDEQFVQVIINAVKNTDVFLFMYSENSAASDWTKKELNFANKRNKHIIFININNTPLDDWFEFHYGEQDIIDFTNEDQKKKVIRNIRDWCGTETMLEEEEERKKDEVKKQLLQLAKDYANKNAELANDAKEIEAKMRLAGITHRICPVCQAKVELSNEYCPTCGCTLSPIYGIKDAEYLLSERKKHIDLKKSIWKNANSSVDEELLSNLQSSLENAQNDLQLKNKQIEDLNSKLRSVQDEYQIRDKDSSEESICKNTKIDNKRISPVFIDKLGRNEYFVFATDDKGSHNTPAAKCAVELFGAIVGCPKGTQGKCYAIPIYNTKNDDVVKAIAGFIEYAKNHSNRKFYVTTIGGSKRCGTPLWIIRLFKDAKNLENVFLPESFYVDSYHYSMFESRTEVFQLISDNCNDISIRGNDIIKCLKLNDKTLDRILKNEYGLYLPQYSTRQTVIELAQKIYDIAKNC